MLLHRKCLFILMNLILATVAKEPSCPACSRYDYEERVLERVLRNELVIETMLKEIRETNANVESALKMMQEDRNTLKSTLDALKQSKEEMHTSLKEALVDVTQNASMAISQIKKENALLKGQLSVPTIYFTAHTLLLDTPANGQVIVYKTMRVNEGQCYDNTTGKFKVSVPGLYVFVVHYCVNPAKHCKLAIVHQGTEIQHAHSQTAGPNLCVAMQAFVKAAFADQIWVQSLSSATDFYEGDSGYNTFSGTLIHL